MKDKLKKIMDDAIAQIEGSEQLDKLNEIKVSFLGKKGELTSVLKSMKEVAPEDRPKVGQMVNEARAVIEEKLESKKAAFEKALMEEKLKSETIDVTLPGTKLMAGHRHPNNITLEEVEKYAQEMVEKNAKQLAEEYIKQMTEENAKQLAEEYVKQIAEENAKETAKKMFQDGFGIEQVRKYVSDISTETLEQLYKAINL